MVVINIPVIIGGHFGWQEFEKFKNSSKVHPVIFARLISNLEKARAEINEKLNSPHWLTSNGLRFEEDGDSEYAIIIMGFTRLLEWSQVEYDRQKKLKDEGKLKRISVSLTSAHHIEEGGSAVDFKVINKRTGKIVPSKVIAKILSPLTALYDYMMPHYNQAGRFFNRYTDEHIHWDTRRLATALGLRR